MLPPPSLHLVAQLPLPEAVQIVINNPSHSNAGLELLIRMVRAELISFFREGKGDIEAISSAILAAYQHFNAPEFEFALELLRDSQDSVGFAEQMRFLHETKYAMDALVAIGRKRAKTGEELFMYSGLDRNEFNDIIEGLKRVQIIDSVVLVKSFSEFANHNPDRLVLSGKGQILFRMISSTR